MPKASRAQVDRDVERVEDLIRQSPVGLGRKEISHAYAVAYGMAPASRTLQRWLERLVREDRVVVVGEGPGTTYVKQLAPNLGGSPENGDVRLSAQGKRLRDLVRRPINQRAPVGYDRDWLYNYKPGKTWYLPKAVRERLHALGATPDGERPAGTFARDILSRLLIDLSWSSSRLEGNTYTRLDTQNLIEFGQQAAGKDVMEAQMILNHKAAIELIVSGSEEIGFNRQTLLEIHAALSENLLEDPRDEGRLREKPVSITGTRYTPMSIPQVIEESFDKLLKTASSITDPFEASFFIMVQLPYLQPFVDINKRTSRLAANIPLVLRNLCPLSFVDVPESAYLEGILAVYEERRTELLKDVYEHAYSRSSAQYHIVRDSLPEPDPVRLRYRSQIASIVGEMVTSMQPPREELVRQCALGLGITEKDLNAVTQRALAQLINLNDGSAGRSGIRPSEFENWKRRFRVNPK